uniref:Xyloglucan endo-transglycosylase C-terminal domain-containing protein n=1 Tax=Arundo donax TaxID=35708 RepID=A0A0A9CVQ5_ARUDO
MSLYATIWDGSSWATSGGRYKVDYKYAPYVAEFTDLALRGCAAGRPACEEPESAAAAGAPAMSPAQRLAMEAFRARYRTYGYCYDRLRYPAPLPECSVGAEAAAFLPSGDARASSPRRHGKRHRPRAGGADSAL